MGARYHRAESATDTVDVTRRVPCFCTEDWEAFLKARPFGAPLVGIEMGGKPLTDFQHPDNCVYVLGATSDTAPPPSLSRKSDKEERNTKGFRHVQFSGFLLIISDDDSLSRSLSLS